MWYGVKLLYKIKIQGKPNTQWLDRFYQKKHRVFFEESVMLVRADSFDGAYLTAEQKADENRGAYLNKYGQTVTAKLYCQIDCYLIGDELENGTELYSTIFSGTHGADKKSLLKERYRRCSRAKMHMLRYAAFSGRPVPPV